MMRNDINFALVAMTRPNGDGHTVVVADNIMNNVTSRHYTNHSILENNIATIDEVTLSTVAAVSEFLTVSLENTNLTEDTSTGPALRLEVSEFFI